MASGFWFFKVSGNGYFPFDMLRYDRCWPARESEAYRLGSRFNGSDSIEMIGYSEPTVRRWNSFGWRVIDIRKGL